MQALRGEDITIYGDGSQTRSFCYVDDMVDAIVLMMNSEKGFVGPVNAGNPNEVTILDLAEYILKLTGSKSKLNFKNLPEDDPRRRKPDITLATKKLLWEPKIDLETGLQKTVVYFKRIFDSQ